MEQLELSGRACNKQLYRCGLQQAALKLSYPLESSPLKQQGLSAGKCEIRLGIRLMCCPMPIS